MLHFRDQEEGGEEDGGGSPLLGILFGNINESGDLDEEYLDQEFKENLSALTGQFKDSLIDIERSGVPPDISGEQEDYSRKADNAVDYEDIQEYCDEGPEDEEAISQDRSFYAQAALAGSLSCLVEDENYDEEEDYDKKEHVEEEDTYKGSFNQKQINAPRESAVQEFEAVAMVLKATEYMCGGIGNDDVLPKKHVTEITAHAPKEAAAPRVPFKPDLPLLYEEDGEAVLWYSEIFPPSEFPWVCRKNRRHSKTAALHLRDKYMVSHSENVEEDEYVLLSSGSTRKAKTLHIFIGQRLLGTLITMRLQQRTKEDFPLQGL